MALSTSGILGQQVKALFPGEYDHVDDETLGTKIKSNPVAMVKFQEAKKGQEQEKFAKENEPGIIGKALEAVSPISQYPGVIADYALTGGKNIRVDPNAPFLSGGVALDKNIGQHARELVERGAAAAATGDVGQLNTYSDDPYAGEEEHVRKAVAKAHPVMAGTEAVLGTIGEKAVDLAADPLLWTLGGAGQVAARGAQARGLLGAGAAATPAAAQALARLASQGKVAGAVATGAGAAFVPGMVEGAIHEGGEAATKFAEGDTVAGLEAGTSATIDAMFAALGAKHAAGAVRGGLASRGSGQKPVATEGAPDPALTGPRHYTVGAPRGAVDTVAGLAAKAGAELVGGGAGAAAARMAGMPAFVGRGPGAHLFGKLLSGIGRKPVQVQAGVPRELKGVPEMEIDRALSPMDELIRTQRAEQTPGATGMDATGEFGRPLNEFEEAAVFEPINRAIAESQEAARTAEAQAAIPKTAVEKLAAQEATIKEQAAQERFDRNETVSSLMEGTGAKRKDIESLIDMGAEVSDIQELLSMPGVRAKDVADLLKVPGVDVATAKKMLQQKVAEAAKRMPKPEPQLSPEEAAAEIGARDPFQTAENVPAGEVGARLPREPQDFQFTPEERDMLLSRLGMGPEQAPPTGGAPPTPPPASVPSGPSAPPGAPPAPAGAAAAPPRGRAYPEGVTDTDVVTHPVFEQVMAEFEAGTLKNSAGQTIPAESAAQARAIARSMAAKAIRMEREKAAAGATAAAPTPDQVDALKQDAAKLVAELKGNEGAIRASATKLGFSKDAIDQVLPGLLAEYRGEQAHGTAIEDLYAKTREAGGAPDMLEQMKAEASKTLPPEPAVAPIEEAKRVAGVKPEPGPSPELAAAAAEAEAAVAGERLPPQVADARDALPPVKPGHTRLYRVEGQSAVAAGGAGGKKGGVWFEKSLGAYVTEKTQPGDVRYVDVPNSELAKLQADPNATEVQLPSKYVANAQPIVAQMAPTAAPKAATAPKAEPKPSGADKAQETAPEAPKDANAPMRAAMDRKDFKAAGDLARKANATNKMKVTVGDKQYGVGDVHPGTGQLILDVEEGGITLLRKTPRGQDAGKGRAYATEKTGLLPSEVRQIRQKKGVEIFQEMVEKGEIDPKTGELTEKGKQAAAERVKQYALDAATQRGGAASSGTPKGRSQYSVEGDFVAVPRKPRALADTELERLRSESEGRGGLTPPDKDTVRPFAEDWLSIEDLKKHQPISKGEKPQYSTGPNFEGMTTSALKDMVRSQSSYADGARAELAKRESVRTHGGTTLGPTSYRSDKTGKSKRGESLIWANRQVEGKNYFEVVKYNLYEQRDGSFAVTVTGSEGKAITRLTADTFEAAQQKAREHFKTNYESQGYVAKRLNETGTEMVPTQYSAEPDALGFYSQAEKVVSDPKAPKKQHGKAWDSYLRSPQRGVTKDEMYWTGLEDFLRENADKPVTSEQIAQYLKANKVEIIERGTTKDLPEVKVEPDERGNYVIVRADPKANIPLEVNVRKSFEEDGGWLYDHPVSGTQYRFNTRKEAVAEAKFAVENRLKDLIKSNTYGTRHASYQEPGEGGARPTNYREIRISVPKTREGENTFEQGAHYRNEPGIVTTFRVNSRKDVNGKKVLFVEEIQSDAGSAAKGGTRRARTAEEQAEASALGEKAMKLSSEWAELHNRKVHSDAQYRYDAGRAKTEAEQRAAEAMAEERFPQSAHDRLRAVEQEQRMLRLALDAVRSPGGGPPNAPFIGSTQKYTDLATKRLLRIAAEEGYDRVAWTPGRVQNARWSITQVADQLYYDGNTLKGFKGGENVFAENVRPEELPNYIGKGATSRLLSSKGEKLAPYTIHERAGGGFVLETTDRSRRTDLGKRYNTRGEAQAALDLMAEKQPTLHRLEGADLEVGEQWANDYYDRVVPGSFEKVGKRFGAKVGKTDIEFTRNHESINSPSGFWVADGIGNPIKWEDFESNSGVTVSRPAGRLAETGSRIDRDYFETRADADAFAKRLDEASGIGPDSNTVQSIEITPEMRGGIVKEGFPQYKGEPKAQGEWKPPTMAEIKKNLPKGLAEKLVKYDDGSYEISTPRGVIRIIPEKKIQVDLEALERGREGAAGAYERGEIKITGEKATFGGEAIVRAVEAGVLPHEVGGHVWLDHFASPKQRQFLRDKFQAEAKKLNKDWREVMADAYSEYHARKLENPGWEPTSKVGKFVQSIYTFMHGLYNNFRPSVEGTFEQVRSGKEFEKAPVKGERTGLEPQYIVTPEQAKGIEMETTLIQGEDAMLHPKFEKEYSAGPRGPRTATADAISRIRDTKQARPGVKGLLETQKVDLTPRIAQPKEKAQYNVEMREKVRKGERIPIVGTGKGGKVLVEDIAKHLHKDTLARIGAATGEDPIKVLARVIEQADREVGYQLDTGRSGRDWYKTDIDTLDREMRSVFPELKDKTPEKTMFKTVVALLSPNTKPNDNLKRAARFWDAWKDTGFDPAKLPIKRPAYLILPGQKGQWGRGSYTAMTKLGRLIKQEGGIDGAVKWLESEHSVRALRDAGWGDFKHLLIDDVATGFEAFGPKVGQFVQNLEGNAGKLTVDKWFMRTWGRYMGTLVDSAGLLRETPLESQRPIMEELATKVGEKYGMDPADVQATLWYYEQQLYKDLGAKIREVSYGESAEGVARQIEKDRVKRGGSKGTGGTPAGGGSPASGGRLGRVPAEGAAEGSLEKKVSGGIARLDQFESVEQWHEHHKNLGFSDKELREALRQREEGEEPASLQKLVGVGDVMIHTPNGREPVKGYDSGTPGLSITHDKGGKGKGLVLTHNGTGLSLGIVVPNTAGAQARLRQFAAEFAAAIGDEKMKDPTKLDRATARKVGQMADEFRSKNESPRRFASAYGKLTPAAKKMAEALDDRVEATTIKSAEQIRALAKKDPVGYALDAATNHLLDNMQRVAHKTDIGREFSAESDPAEIYKGGFVNRNQKSRYWIGLRKPVWLANRTGEFGAGEVYVQRGNALVDSIDKRFGIRYDNLKTEMAKIARGDASAIEAAMETYVYSLQHTLAHEVLHGFRGTVDVPGLFKVAGKMFGRDAIVPKYVTRNEGRQMQARMNLSATELLETKLPDGTTIRDGLKQYFDSPKMREHLRAEMQAQARRSLKDRGIKYDISPEGLTQAMSFREKMAKEEALGKASGKTAMSRTKASAPARQYVDHVKGKTVFDWGAGQGADMKFFKESGATEVKGYDPNHMPDKPEGMADVVTSTYVGNVLPPVPRRQMFVEAFSRAKEKLLVAVRSDKISGDHHEDGVITSTGTFQKSYKPGELVTELEKLFGNEATVESKKAPSGASMAIVTRKTKGGRHAKGV